MTRKIKKPKPHSSHRKDPGIVDGKRPPERIGSFFLDSGAHALYNAKISRPDSINSPQGEMTEHQKQVLAKMTGGQISALRRQSPNLFKGIDVYSFYSTPEFWQYVDAYAAFVKAHPQAIDFYVNVDAIYNPEISWRVLKYLEHEHGLSPVPVIHADTPLKWIDKHLEEGYKFIGLGGLGQYGTIKSYIRWADRVYKLLCPASNGYKPIVKTHGFAMTAHKLMIRYPWWSVDSSSWTKAGAYGIILMPQRKHGKYRFDLPPWSVHTSIDSPSRKKQGKRNKHWLNLTDGERKKMLRWLEEIGVPIGSATEDGEMIEFGIVSHHSARKIANLRYFQALCDWMPEWPWSFRATPEPMFDI